MRVYAQEAECQHCRWRQYVQDKELFRCDRCQLVNVVRAEIMEVRKAIPPFDQEASVWDYEAMVRREAEDEWWREFRSRPRMLLVPPDFDRNVNEFNVRYVGVVKDFSR